MYRRTPASPFSEKRAGFDRKSSKKRTGSESGPGRVRPPVQEAGPPDPAEAAR